MEKPKYTSIFASLPVECIVGEEKDKQLSLASYENLKSFIPDIDPQKDIDILPIAFGAFVANRINKNGDVIDTSQALGIYKRFIKRFIDSEHNRTKVIGVITTASLTEFGTDKPLTEEDVIGKTFPFNVTLGGILWKAVNNDLCDLVEESSDPSSVNYMSVYASWELGFSEFRIIELPIGEKNLVNPIEVSDLEDKEKIKKYLKCFGGSGVKDGKSYYRMPCQDVIPMGIGLTEKPAADVSPVVANITPNEDKIETKADLLEVNGQNTISQSDKLNVKIERNINMKINSIADITDESLKQCTASVISEFISSEITKASKEFASKASEKETQFKTIEAQYSEVSKNVSEMKATIAALQKEKEDREGVDCFNRHMNEVYAEYDMPAEVSSVIAEQIKAANSDESFTKWKAGASILLKPYNRKEAIAAKMKESPKADDKDKDKATTSNSEMEDESQAAADKKDSKKKPMDDDKDGKKANAAIASAVEDALDNGTTEKGGLPNGTSAASPTFKQKYAEAFATDNFIVT